MKRGCMENIGYVRNPGYLLHDQYRDASNLSARSSFYDKFSEGKPTWFAWQFDAIDLKEGDKILDCGCGNGQLWAENAAKIPSGCSLYMLDISKGMLKEARTALSGLSEDIQCTFLEASIEDIPASDKTFDVVVANQMLYHVSSIPRALHEVNRVLKRGGAFYASTYGEAHMEELDELFYPYFSRWRLSFALENGFEILEDYFDTLEVLPLFGRLRITEAEPLLRYILSTASEEIREDAEVIESMLYAVQSIISLNSSFDITKSAGMFKAC